MDIEFKIVILEQNMRDLITKVDTLLIKVKNLEKLVNIMMIERGA